MAGSESGGRPPDVPPDGPIEPIEEHLHDVICSVTEDRTYAELMSVRLFNDPAYTNPDAMNENIPLENGQFNISQSEQWSDDLHVNNDQSCPYNSLNMNSSDELTFTQDSYIPSQKTYEQLDNILHKLPRELYIEKLSQLSNNNENLITWYRTILFGRASTVQGCPKGKLCTRKTTLVSSSIKKYAKDCYIINSFINGDDSEIDTVLSKPNRQIQNPENVISETIDQNPVHSVDLSSIVQSLVERVTSLEKSVKMKESSEKELKERVSKLEGIVEANYGVFDRFQAEIQPKIQKCEATIKTFDTTLECIGEFDIIRYREGMAKLNSEVNRISNCVSTVQKSLRKLQTPVKQYKSPPDKETIQNIPEASGVQLENKCYSSTSDNMPIEKTAPPMNTNPNVEHEAFIEPISCNGDSVLRLIPPIDMNNYCDTVKPSYREALKKASVQPATPSYHIPVCMNRSSENPYPADNVQTVKQNEHLLRTQPETNGFTSAKRERTARFYVTNISMESTRQDMSEFLEHKGVMASNIIFFRPKKGRQSAKFNAPVALRDEILHDKFWPSGMICRHWYNNREWNDWLNEQNPQHQS